jgi:hypothetical protein
MLGLTLDPDLGVLTVEPALPEWLHEISISALTVRGLSASMRVARDGDDYIIETEGPIQPRTAHPGWQIPPQGT